MIMFILKFLVVCAAIVAAMVVIAFLAALLYTSSKIETGEWTGERPERDEES